MPDGNTLRQLVGLRGAVAADGGSVQLRLGTDRGEIRLVVGLPDLAGLLLKLEQLAAQAVERREQQPRSQRRTPAAPSLQLEAKRGEGRTSPAGEPLLALTLDDDMPLLIGLTPVTVLSLGSFLAAARPKAARQVEQAALDRDRRHVDDAAEEPAERSSLARLL